MAWTSVNIIGYTIIITMLSDDPVRKEESITVHGSILEGVAPSVKPENKSVIRMCPVFSSALFMVSTCTTSLNCVTSVSMMFEWCVHILHFLIMRLRLLSKLGSHFLAAVGAVFNFTKEPCTVFAGNFLKSSYTVGDFANNDLTKSFSFALLFKFGKLWHTRFCRL